MPNSPRLLIFSQPEVLDFLDDTAFAAAGYAVKIVSTLTDVGACLDADHPESVLIIVHPSAESGLEDSSEILKSNPWLPIILVTSEVSLNYLQQALRLGLADYLVTPVEPSSLFQAIERTHIRLDNLMIGNTYARVINELADGFILVSLELRLLLINHSAYRLLHINDDQPEGKLVYAIIDHPDILDIFKPDREFPYKNEITLEDRRVYSVHSSLVPNVGIALILHEITHLKELDRIKTDFVSSVSHDFRSPLTAIYGFVGLLDRVGPVNEQQAEFIQHIQSSLQQITSLINDLFELGRVESGFDLQMVEVNLKDILTQAMGNLAYQSQEKKLEVVVSVPEEIPPVYGNPLHLLRMVTNLIENAIKFTPPKGKINVCCTSDTGQLILEVADNGPEIPPNDRPHVFEKFYRGGNISNATPGTGLGLSIVKSIVEKHHGRIWLDSSPQGTTFTVILPIK
jgi:two-component system phosphate regulon sensor histidine kinase PhoR